MSRSWTTVQPDLLTDRRMLVAGGTGNVGRVVVEAFLAAGATVVVPSRSTEKLAELKSRLVSPPGDHLIGIVGDLSDEADAVRVRYEVLDRAGPLDGVVSSLGRFVPAPSVLQASRAELQRALDGYLLAHFMVAKTLIPVLEERSGSFTFINGPLAFSPMFPGTGLVSIVTAGQAMLARTVMHEEADGRVRINELVIHTRFGDGDGEESGAVSRSDVARYLAYLASEAGAGVRGETIHLNTLEPLRALAGQA